MALKPAMIGERIKRREDPRRQQGAVVRVTAA